MKPYLLIEGSNDNIDDFENKISEALEVGYVFESELISHMVQTTKGVSILFYQAMALEEDFDDELDEEDDL